MSANKKATKSAITSVGKAEIKPTSRSKAVVPKVESPIPVEGISAVESLTETNNDLGSYIGPLFQHPRLRFKYPIIEIATLAASFKSEDFHDRLDSAVDMLDLIERISLLPVETNIRNESRKRLGPMVDDLSPQQQKRISEESRYRQQFTAKCRKILDLCEREKRLNRVTRASLIAEVCKDINGSASPNYDPEVFNEWLDSLKEQSTGDPRSLGTQGFRYETARGIKFIPDDDAAFCLIEGFHQWLRRRRKPGSPLRSAMRNTFVSNKNKGAATDDEGKYRKK